MSFDIKKIRSDFPALDQKINGKTLVYLDNGATTLKCQDVIDAVSTHYQKESANIHRGIHTLSEKATSRYEETRALSQSYLNAKHLHEIIFTKGTTDSINLVAQSFGTAFIKEGQTILLSTMEHHSNIVPWQIMAAERKAQVKEVPINDHGEILLDQYLKLLKSHDVAIVSFVAISNILGTINPIKKMVQMAHQHGAKFMVDAAQSPIHGPIDVQDWDVDFAALSSHKAIGPTGVGLLYAKEDLLNAMPPYQTGGAMIKSVSFEQTTFNILPEKFEAGTPNIAGVIAFKEALQYLKNLDHSAVSSYTKELIEYAQDQLLTISGLKIIGTAKNKTSIVSFVIEGAHPHDLGSLLDKQGVAIRTGHHCAQPLMKRFNIDSCSRASFAFYNTKEEVDLLVAAIKKALEFL